MILELAGIKNVVAKSLGCWDKQKNVLATIEGLKELKSKVDE